MILRDNKEDTLLYSFVVLLISFAKIDKGSFFNICRVAGGEKIQDQYFATSRIELCGHLSAELSF